MLCVRCSQDKSEEYFYFDRKKNKRAVWCRDCFADYARNRRKSKAGAGGFCTGCYKPCEEARCELCKNKIVDKEKQKARVKKFRSIHAERLTVEREEKRRTLKLSVMEAYGGQKCHCPGSCDITALEFLTIDHIAGGGHQHRKKIGNMYRWLVNRKFPPGYRPLCMNCNFSLGKYGYCPHQKEHLSK